MADYISSAATAVLVRKAVARHFPGTKFWVRKRSGGSSITVSYDASAPGAPAKADVAAVVSPFGGEGFDSMTDSSYGKTIALDVNGDVIGTSSYGGGMVPAWDHISTIDPARIDRVVHPLATYVFVDAYKPWGVA